MISCGARQRYLLIADDIVGADHAVSVQLAGDVAVLLSDVLNNHGQCTRWKSSKIILFSIGTCIKSRISNRIFILKPKLACLGITPVIIKISVAPTYK